MLAKSTHQEKNSLIALSQAQGLLHQCLQPQLHHCQMMSISVILQPVLSEGVYLCISRVTGMLWCDMTDMHLAHDPNTPISAHVRSDHFMTHLQGPQQRRGSWKASLTCSRETCTAHEMAQELWGCCISINKPAQTPVSKLCNGEKRVSLPSCVTEL